ncbi:MAG: hypothetical protein HOP16_05725 [Acidobacteria bacterium]|nr:hypothetical protein [Acidobacteriota bacterium]
MTLISFCACLIVLLVSSEDATAQSIAAGADSIASAIELAPAPAQATAPPPPVAFDYTDGYRLRARIHKAASFATLPLFAAEGIIGQSLYSNPTQGKKDAHLAAAAGIGALCVVNTTTGVWNLIEARKDPVHRGRRLAHGLMMLAADAGFLATAALGPESEHGSVEGSRGAHRAVAFTSIGLAGASYLIMLFEGS